MIFPGLEDICNIAIQVLEQKAFCQQDPDQDEEDDAPEDQAEYDSVLISSASDLVAALAAGLGADFGPAFHTFFPLIAKYYVSPLILFSSRHMLSSYIRPQNKNRSMSDRSSSIGSLAEVISGMKSAITPFTEPLLELLYKALSDSEAEVLSNAAYAIGLLVENSEVDLSPQYLHLLGALRPLFDVNADAPSAHLNAKDNAAGAVARLIVRNTVAIPLDQVLPTFFNVLPLKNDYLENEPVFRAIFHLFRNSGASLLPHLDHLLKIFAVVLDPSGPDQVGDEIRAELIALIGLLNAEQPGKVQAAGLDVYL